jgi:hypothetical protein
MSSSSPEGSPTSASGGRRQQFSISRDKFQIDIPENHLTLITNGDGQLNGNLTSPNSLKSPNGRRVAGFSREGILGSAQKARNLSQSSGDRESMTNGIQNRQNSDDGINPLKRRSTDAGIDYPRRRATIAVRKYVFGIPFPLLTSSNSAKYVAPGNHDVMERNRSVSSVQSLVQNVSIANLVSNLMPGTNSSWSISLGLKVCFNQTSSVEPQTSLCQLDHLRSMEELPSATMR